MNSGDTIFALSSGGGIGGVAVVRLSGKLAGPTLCAMVGGRQPEARRASLAMLRDPDSGVVLDEGLVLWFPGPQSFTGEDVVEFHLHGGRAVVMGVLGALGGVEGLRLAEGGEFTRRALQHGRVDLVQAEAIGDLVLAETESQRDQALRQSMGGLSRHLSRWQQGLIGCLAHLEAEIDFGEDDLPGGLAGQVNGALSELKTEIGAVLAAPQGGERLREGYLVSILGPPNVGKSSLLNALAGSDVAIVSSLAGTTRDVVETRLVMGGVPVTFADTAGLREGGGEIEKEGMRRARAVGQRSDLQLVVFDARDPRGRGGVESGLGGKAVGVVVFVANKCDLVSAGEVKKLGLGATCISAKTGQGLGQLRDRVFAGLGWVTPRSDGLVLTRARHRRALQDCYECVGRAMGGGQGEMVAEDVRLAVRALGRILGSVDVEDILDVVFRDFCIGK